MEYRRLGRTGLMVSAVGFGTNELRLLPREQALATLLRSFALGVNLVHTSPDYEGAEEIVAEAVARSGRRIIVASQGYDIHGSAGRPAVAFERHFEETCRRLGTRRLDLYGIAAVDDREALDENVWGPGGMVEFLQAMRREGRLGGIYCTNHGEARHTMRLLRSGAFDAVMISLNPLGYHLLTLHPPASRHFEDVRTNWSEVVPLCQELDIGVLAMMPLAGGLLVGSQAFPARRTRMTDGGVTAEDVLRSTLADSRIASVVPGMASIAEVEHNVQAGTLPAGLAPERRTRLDAHVAQLQSTVCSRCGLCEPTCSKSLPISWLFRAGEMAAMPAEAFETWPEVDYFRLHPGEAATCAGCRERTCHCPAGIAIPTALMEQHAFMRDLRDHALVAPAPDDPRGLHTAGDLRARVLMADLPASLAPGQTVALRLQVENLGSRGWFPQGAFPNGGALLAVLCDGRRIASAGPWQVIHQGGGRGHFVVEITAPDEVAAMDLRLVLLSEHLGYAEDRGLELLHRRIPIQATAAATTGLTATAPAQSGVAMGKVDRRGVDWREDNLPACWPADEPFWALLRMGNTGSMPWRATDPAGRPVHLVIRLGDRIYAMVPLPHDVPPGGEVLLRFWLRLPANGEATTEPFWTVRLNLVEQQVAWFEQDGVPSLERRIAQDTRGGADAAAMAILRRANPAAYLPSQGVPRDRRGRPFPRIIARAVGARIEDPAGARWIDYVMGWGSALLGYAEPRIASAIGEAMAGGAILSLPHVLEAEATRLVQEAIPSAEMVLFGKNGSDACTAAIRAARLTTGRRVILFSGYHGWQDPFAPWYQPDLAPTGTDPEAIRFDAGDLLTLDRLLERHRGAVAAVMLEPAAQVEGVDGPVRDADPAFLTAVQIRCRNDGCLLVFDEIMTGFRHRGGSVQADTGIIPDLTCLGKGMASGMALAALVGRRQVLEHALPRLFYHPTFKGDAYAFASAVAALGIHRSEDVPGRVAAFGERLRVGIDTLAAEHGIPGNVIGVPYRMVFRFTEPDPVRRTALRTLLQQELLLNGVLTFRGFMLPSLAHGEAELVETLAAFRIAFQLCRQALIDDRIESRIEIPPVV